MKIDVLRRATAVDHKRVEAAFPLMSGQMDRNTYVRYLQALYGFIAAWEDESLRMAPDSLRELIRSRSRLEMLDADLAWFGVAPCASERPAMPGLSTIARLFGAMYVMEGSALGGQFIARHLEAVLSLEPGYGDAYFRGSGERTASRWVEFCDVLERTVAADESEEAISGAREMFSVFEGWQSAFDCILPGGNGRSSPQTGEEIVEF